MPLYQFRCDFCDPPSRARARHTWTQGLTLAQYDAEKARGFSSIRHARCGRSGRSRTDHLAGGRAETFYTFGENAPDPLVGRTVDAGTKRKLLKQYGLAEGGNTKARTDPGVKRYSAKEVLARWQEKMAEAPPPTVAPVVAPRPPRAPEKVALDKHPTHAATLPKARVSPHTDDTLVAENWNELRRQAKRFGIKFSLKDRRPKLERLVRGVIEEQAARSANP